MFSILSPVVLGLALVGPDELPARLLFERNQGAFDDAVVYVARGAGLSVFACDDAVVLHVSGALEGAPDVALKTRFVGSNASPAVSGEQQCATRVHHLGGRESDGWSVDNATFAQVRYEQLWEGVDLVLYDAAGQLEYDFVVDSGIDPSVVQMHFDGAHGLALDENGDLLVATAAGELRQSAPVVYQRGHDGPELVEGAYRLLGDGGIGFTLGDYDTDRTLVIDPVLSYATYLTGNNYVHITDVTVGPSGSAYVCGYTRAPDLPTTVGVLQPAHANINEHDAIVGKLSPNGTTIEWLTYLGGEGPTGANCCAPDLAFSIGLDGAGNVVVGGWTGSTDFPLLNPIDMVIQNSDGFLTKLLPDGSGLVFSTYLGGSPQGTGIREAVHDLAVDDAGNVWVTGTYGGASELPATPGSLKSVAHPWGMQGYAMRFDPVGNLVWATYVGGDVPYGTTPDFWAGILPVTYGRGIAVDSSQRVYISGDTNTSDFPLAGACDALGPSSVFDDEHFVVRLSADGTSLDYGTFLGGTGGESYEGQGLACADDGRVWLAAASVSTDYPTSPGAFDDFCEGGLAWDGVLTCLDTTQAGAASMVFSTYVGGYPSERFTDIAIDAAGNAYVAGWSASSGYPVQNAWQSEIDGANNAVLSVFDAAGELVNSTYFGKGGATWTDQASLALGPDGDAYLAFTTNDLALATPGAAVTDPTPLSYSGMVTRWRMDDPVCQADLGFAGPGSATLSLCGGDLSAGVLSKLRLESTGGAQLAFIFVGTDLGPTFVPDIGGTLAPVPFLIQGLLATDNSGELELLVHGGFGPLTLYAQVVIAQPSEPLGWAVSNALQLEALP